jgi:lipopolysaccharide/colanic/teichoic acid biosynthesis glycosyltransferase
VEFITFLESIITGIVSRVAAEELKAWSPTIVTKFTAIAVDKLPVEQRERLAEEWESHLNAIPGDLSKIVFAFDLIRAARRISVESRNRQHSIIYRSAKRSLDLAIAATSLFVMLPVLLVISIAVKTTSPGPIFFSEERIGRDGRRFLIRKFRTMYVNSQVILRRHLMRDPEDTEDWIKTGQITADPRVTSIGRILRKYSLDELPQFWNVLTGEMSLVGPPPLRGAHHVNATTIHDGVKPGITGLWQISQYDWSRPNAVDQHQVEKESFWLDIKTMGRTILVGLKNPRRK